MNNDTLALLAELRQHASDPVAFSAIKHKLLGAYFDSLDPECRPGLLALQSQIEAANALAGTPHRAVSALVEDLSDRHEALDLMKDRLRELAKALAQFS